MAFENKSLTFLLPADDFENIKNTNDPRLIKSLYNYVNYLKDSSFVLGFSTMMLGLGPFNTQISLNLSCKGDLQTPKMF